MTVWTPLLPIALREALRRRRPAGALDTPWWPIFVVRSLGSTQDRIAELEASGAGEGAVVIATAQEAGRGRRGRKWHSPPGAGLYLSVLLRPEGNAQDAVHWSMAAAVAACDALREFGAEAAIKWPNDLLVGGLKVGGLLVETVSVGSRLRAVMVGCGINVAHGAGDFPQELRGSAVSLAMATGRAPQRGEVAVAFLACLGEEAARLRADGAESLRSRWMERSPASDGGAVTVVEGAEEWEGRTRGLGPDGALAVETAEGALRWLRLGEEVRIRPA